MEKDTKWVIGAIIVIGIAVTATVSSLNTHQIGHVWNEFHNHERRVEDSTSNIIIEFQRLFHEIQSDVREDLHDVEDELRMVKQALDALTSSPAVTAHGMAEQLREIQHALRHLKDSLDNGQGAEQSSDQTTSTQEQSPPN